jgi:hypothetical protein
LENELCFANNITFFKGGPIDPSLQEKEHPIASKIHAILDSYPLQVEVLLEEALCTYCDQYCTVKKL